MRFTVFSLILIALVFSQEKPTYYPTGNEANLAGTISLKGTLPKLHVIDMSADPACQDLSRNPRYDILTTNQNRIQNAFIYLKGANLDAYNFPMPDADVTLNQRACYFEPHVFGLRVGQTLRILNSDPTVHNVHPTPKNNPEWNQSHASNSAPILKTFKRAEVMVPIKCNQHPWMKAYAGVMNHPYFAVSDRSGKFEIRGLPAGTYKLVVWHAVFGEQEIEVTLVPGENRNADFTFDAAAVLEDVKYKFERDN